MSGTSHFRLLVQAACCCALTLTFAGCYDGEALVRETRSTALNARLAEVDLGKYHTTLPRDQETAAFVELNLHMYGTVPRSRLSKIKSQLAVEEFRLRHEMLAAVRSASIDELAEPNLAQLRKRIEGVINRILSDSPIRSVGFYEMTLRQS